MHATLVFMVALALLARNAKSASTCPSQPIAGILSANVQDYISLAATGTLVPTPHSYLNNGNVGSFPTPGTSLDANTNAILINVVNHRDDSFSSNAQADLQCMYYTALNKPAGTPIVGDLGGQVLHPGIYDSASGITLTGIVTLDALGDPDGAFLIRAASTLTTSSGSVVLLAGGAQACNIVWLVGSLATLGTRTSFAGTILAQESITLQTGTRVTGRVLAMNQGITLDTSTVTMPGCISSTAVNNACADCGYTQVFRLNPESQPVSIPMSLPLPTPTPTPTPTPMPTPTSVPTPNQPPVPTPVLMQAMTPIPTLTPLLTPTPMATPPPTPIPTPMATPVTKAEIIAPVAPLAPNLTLAMIIGSTVGGLGLIGILALVIVGYRDRWRYQSVSRTV